MENLNLLSK